MEEKHWLYSHIGCQMNYSTHHEPQNETYTLTLDNIEEAIEFGDTIAQDEESEDDLWDEFFFDYDSMTSEELKDKYILTRR